MNTELSKDFCKQLLEVAIAEANAGLREGGVPVGGAVFAQDGTLLGKGRNRRVQEDDPSVHGETDAFRNAGRQRTYADKILVTTLAPCWYCGGLIKQFRFGTVIIGESENFQGSIDWLRELPNLRVVDLDSEKCKALLREFIAKYPEIWNEDIGVD